MKKTKGTPKKKDSIIKKVLHLAFELSETKWKLGFSDGKKMRFKSITARDLEQLHEEIEKAKERSKLKGEIRIVSCCEAGRDGFWLHRYLLGLLHLSVSYHYSMRQFRLTLSGSLAAIIPKIFLSSSVISSM